MSLIWTRSVAGGLRSGPDPGFLIFLLSRIWAESGPDVFASVPDPGSIWSRRLRFCAKSGQSLVPPFLPLFGGWAVSGPAVVVVFLLVRIWAESGLRSHLRFPLLSQMWAESGPPSIFGFRFCFGSGQILGRFRPRIFGMDFPRMNSP